VFDEFITFLKRFSFSEIKINDETFKSNTGDLLVYEKAEMLISSNINKDEIIAKLKKDIAFEESEIARSNNMLNNPNFISKAPEAKVNMEKEKLAKHIESLASLKEKLKNL